MMSESRIRSIRKARKISGTAVAKELGISPQHYYDIEKGKNGLSAENAVKLAEIFEVPLDYLLGRSINALIEDRLSELNMSYKDLAKETELPEIFLNSLDTVTPQPWDYEKGEIIDKIAKALKMDFKTLKSAFARQEPPVYNGSSDTRSLEKIFADEHFDDKNQSTPTWATSKDKRDFKKMLEEDAPVMFDGVPLDEEDKEKVLKVMEAIFWDAKKRNKRKPIEE